MKLRLFILIPLLLLSVYLQGQENTQVKRYTILGLGDSITEGGDYFQGYLFPLWQKLFDGGYAFDFVGPRLSKCCIGTLNHAGFSGKNAEFLDTVIDTLYRNHPADIVLLHAGHNHFDTENPVAGIVAAQEAIVHKIKAINPQAKILIAQVITSGKLPKYSYISGLNIALARMVERIGHDDIVLVDQATGFDWEKYTIYDRVHPNEAGAERMAGIWYAALQKVMQPSPPPCQSHIITDRKTEGCDNHIKLENERIKIQWKRTSEGIRISSFQVKKSGIWVPWGTPDGNYTILYSAEKPNEEPVSVIQQNGDTVNFPDSTFKYIIKTFKRAVSEVPMNRAGREYTFFPDVYRQDGQSIVFEKNTDIGQMTVAWEFDQDYPDDIRIHQTFITGKDGYYSLASSSAATLAVPGLGWGIVPGFYQGDFVNPDFVHSYAYAQGLPEFPVLCRESTITTPTSILMDKDSCTMAVTIEPGQASDRYPGNENRHDKDWRIALSHMNRQGQLAPTAYHPVLGESGSYCKAGDTLTFDYRFTLNTAGWYPALKHAMRDVYRFDESLQLKSATQSLTERVLAMYRYLVDDQTSHWNVEAYKGMKIGAQSYLGGVAGADHDAMKNSDVGAVWMLAALTGDETLKKTRLPYIRNFKIAQQQDQPGFFEGAAKGQYYLAKKKEFVEEWGNHFEPIGLTYYTLIDIGNILLFEPDDQVLLEKLKAGAERLLSWQHDDGSWPVAFDRNTHEILFNDLQDTRPTFYGMYVAYRILKDPKYLEAAKKGADWFIKKAVNGTFIGVCGDVRFVNDFATAQSVQALLDMYDVTKNEKYKEVAIQVAKMYTSSVYTYPIPGREPRTRKGKLWEDWQLSQVGLGFEHGGTIGSAVLSGPILLAGHAGLFMRMFQLTGDSLFVTMARAGALGRDAFVNEQSKVASYYWTGFDNGPGQFPHHAWWQVGWIMDYLVAEMEARSGGRIRFPRGFVTPKVGPHQTVGFTSGTIDGQEVSLILPLHFMKVDNPNIDYLLAASGDKNNLYIILMNQQQHPNSFTWKIDPAIAESKGFRVKQLSGTAEMAPWGIRILKL